jgi:SAM-dependent methyltransferase
MGTPERISRNIRPGASWLRSEPSPAADYEQYAEIYDLEYPDADADGAFWEDLARSAGRMLEVGCGSGRLTERMVEHSRVTGVDPSTAMLAVARGRLAGRPGAELIRGDVRDLPLGDHCVDLAVAPFGALSYVLSPNDLLAAAHELYRVLRPGGRVVVDLPHIPLGHPYACGDTPLRLSHVTAVPGGRLVHFGEARLDTQWNVCRYAQITDDLAGDGRLRRRLLHRHHWHLYTPFELVFLFMVPGFTVIDLYGGYGGETFTSSSERLILMAQRPS